MKFPVKVRWVVSELGELKREADSAGVEFRDAKRRCFSSNIQYYLHRELLKRKPVKQLFYVPSPERLAQLQAEAVDKLRYWDGERQAACVSLDAAKLRLDKAVWKYREAKSLMVGYHES